jgi:hypothetical protein
VRDAVEISGRPHGAHHHPEAANQTRAKGAKAVAGGGGPKHGPDASEGANRNRQERFTALMDHIAPDLLTWGLPSALAKGCSRRRWLRWDEYAVSLNANIEDQ